MTGVPVGLLLTVAVAGILLAGLLSAGEAAVVRVTRTAVAEAVEEGGPAAARLVRLTADRARTAGALAFGRITAEMTATACVTLCLGAVLGVWWHVLLLAIVVSTLVALVLVRLSPRSLGRRHPLAVLSRLGGLLVATLVVVGWAARLSSATPRAEDDSDDELRDMVERVSESEVIEEDERELIRSVFGLGDTMTREVMVPRTDMVTIPDEATLGEALSVFLRSGFSRVPVVGESVDDLRGVAYFKDVVARLDASGGTAAERSAHIDGVMRPALLVPESKPVDDLMRELQAASSHMALVVDEYGGIAGLVTMEDAIEEIVGEVTDEHDSETAGATDLGDGRFRVPARMSLDDLGELLDLEIDDDEVDTAGGLLAKALGQVPLAGAEADIDGAHLQADGFEGRRKRLATLVVRRTQPHHPDTSQELVALDGPQRGRSDRGSAR